MISLLRRTLLPFVTAVALAAASASAQTISLPENDSPTFGFGKGNATTTFGQTFTTPTGFNFLQSFSFWLSDDVGLGATNPGNLLFQAYVMQWDGANGYATGPVLYTSSIQTGPTALSQRYTFAATNTAVSANTQYVAFVSASSQLSNILGTDASAVLESSLLGTYTGGQFVYTNNGGDFGALSMSPWEFTGFPEYQTHFEATFSNAAVSLVPEPSSLVLLAGGLVTVMLLTLKRKRV